MRAFNSAVCALLLLCSWGALTSLRAQAEDDYILGRYEHTDKLKIELNEWSGHVSGDGKYVAGFIEAFYDNLSPAYREKPELRRQVLDTMAQAKKAGKKGFALHNDEYMIAFQDTIGWKEWEAQQ